jgi:hypothetical protein
MKARHSMNVERTSHSTRADSGGVGQETKVSQAFIAQLETGENEPC